VVLLLAEVACIAVLLAGIALLSVPVAMIVGGLLGVVVFERASNLRRARAAQDDLAPRRRKRAA
jgi:hypothetical protein